MPPVGPQGSRGGLITAVVVFTIGFVISTIFALYYGVALSKAEEQNKALNDKSRLIYTNIASPRYDQLAKERENNDLQDRSILGASIQDSADLANLVAGGSASTTQPTAAIDLARHQLDDIAQQLPDLHLPSDVSLMDALDKLAKFASTEQQKASQLKASADNSDSEAKKIIENHQAAMDKLAADVEQYKTEKEHALQEVQRLNSEYERKLADAQVSLDTDRAEFNKELQQHQITEGDLGRRIDDLNKRNQTLQDKLSMRRVSPEEPTVRQSDGSVLSVAQDNIVYINLGSGDHIVPGMTFEVYDKQDGVPGLSSDSMSDQNLPVGLGSIEVRQVDQNASQCRIVKLEYGHHITQGDPIANLVYDRNTKFKFVVYGRFDLAHTNRPTDADREKVEGLVRAWGGDLQGKIDVDTDFVIMGAEPKVEQFTQDELSDPFNAQQKRNQEEELKNYNAVLNEAKELHIPVMNQNRFLYFCGYYENAQR